MRYALSQILSFFQIMHKYVFLLVYIFLYYPFTKTASWSEISITHNKNETQLSYYTFFKIYLYFIFLFIYFFMFKHNLSSLTVRSNDFPFHLFMVHHPVVSGDRSTMQASQSNTCAVHLKCHTVFTLWKYRNLEKHVSMFMAANVSVFHPHAPFCSQNSTVTVVHYIHPYLVCYLWNWVGSAIIPHVHQWDLTAHDLVALVPLLFHLSILIDLLSICDRAVIHTPAIQLSNNCECLD